MNMHITIPIAAALMTALLFIPKTGEAPPAIATEEPAIIIPALEPLPEAGEYAYLPTQTPESIEKIRTELWAIARAKGLPDAKIREIEGTIGGVYPYTNKTCPRGESGWYPGAVGDNGESFGLVQINLPWNPNVTAEQALDVTYALNFIVDSFLAGHERRWTCWRVLFGS